MTEYTVQQFRNEIRQYVAEPQSKEGQAVIHNDKTHVSELWEDGEITSTKSGDLYGARLLHQSRRPILESANLLWDPDEGNDHKKMVIVDREAVDELLDGVELIFRVPEE